NEARQHARSDEQTERPDPEMQHGELEPGAPDRLAPRLEPLWYEIEIGRVDEKQPTSPETGHAAPREEAHAAGRGPSPSAAHPARSPRAREDRVHDGKTARLPITRRDGDLDRVDTAPAGEQRIEHGLAETRGAACAGHRKHAGRARRLIEARER